MNKLRSILPLFLCGLLLSAWPARSQSLRGSIVGRVTDASNKPLANAEVSVVEEETNRARTARTSANGGFVITLLPPGTYRVEASVAGYRTSLRTVVLLVNQEINIDIPLLPARSVEHVEVSTEAGLMNTESATLSTVVRTARSSTSRSMAATRTNWCCSCRAPYPPHQARPVQIGEPSPLT